jgi:hypothetical protein
VTSREEHRALRDLTELLARDLSVVDTEEIAAGVRDAEATRDAAARWSGRLLRELRARDVSWSQIVALTGLPQTTAHRRVSEIE